MRPIKVKEIMTVEPCMIQSTQTVTEAAALMKSKDYGVLPVGKADNIIGMITDRDIPSALSQKARTPRKH